jgi:hypothetical protein
LAISILLQLFPKRDPATSQWYNEIQNPILWLHLILDTCQSFEEANNYDTWRKNEGYQDTSLYQSLYQQLSNTIPKIRDIIGAEVIAVDYHHIEFNTDIAKALREYKL